jgi:uncharacterized Zn finger protein
MARKSVRQGSKKRPSIRQYLEGLTPSELISYILEVAGKTAEVQRDLEQRAVLAGGKAGDLVRQARKELQRVTEADDGDEWGEGGAIPDYSNLQALFERLLEAGQADVLLDLGRELVEAANEQVESSAEGEPTEGIVECLNVVFRAVPLSRKSDADKLLYVIDLCELDEYDLAEGADALLERDWPEAAWSAVADELVRRLAGIPILHSQEFVSQYKRSRLVDWLATALSAAGRDAEVLPLLESEAVNAGRYLRLVDELLARKRVDDARRWLLQGIEKSRERWPSNVRALRERWRELAARKKDWPTVAAMHAASFFHNPSVHSLRELLAAARKARCEDAVRAAALHFLETGVRPGETTPTGKGGTRTSPPAAGDWPLPVLPAALLEPPWPGQAAAPGPHYDVLLDLALAENRPDDVLHWYDRLGKTGMPPGEFGYRDYRESVADTVAATHPDRALALYREIIAGLLAHTKVWAYEQARPTLRKVKALLEKNKRAGEWAQYLAELRETHHRKPRLLEVLDRVERDRTSGSRK